jgi:hypothetical protein
MVVIEVHRRCPAQVFHNNHKAANPSPGVGTGMHGPCSAQTIAPIARRGRPVYNTAAELASSNQLHGGAGMTNLAHTWSEPDLYLVADDDLIHESRNIKRHLCAIEKSPEPVIVPDRPWEGKIASGAVNSLQDPLCGTVLFDPAIERFRCWYNVYNRRFDRDIRFRLYMRKAKFYALKVATHGPIWSQEEQA